MINWDDPDYQSAGHFYALIQSVNITCNDPTTPATDVTGYVYGSNTTADTPSVSMTNQSTVEASVNGAAGLTGPWNTWTVVAVMFALLGASLA